MPYQDKPSSAPAIPYGKEGRSKNINDIISAIAVESLLALKKDGNYENNFSIGDNSLNALVNKIKIRLGTTIEEYDNTGANLLRTLTLGSATTTAQGFRYLDNPIKISNNPTNPLTEIDISAGVMTFDDGSESIYFDPTIKTRSTANDFANGGLLPNGTVLQTNTFYYVFAIYSTSSNLVNFYADTSKTSPTLPIAPNNYDKKQYRGAFYVDASGNIATGNYTFFNWGYKFAFPTITESNDNVFLTTEKTIPLTIPIGNIAPQLAIFIQGNSSGNAISDITYYSNKDQSINRIVSNGSGTSLPHNFNITNMIIDDKTLRYKSAIAFTGLRASVFNSGWIDYET